MLPALQLIPPMSSPSRTLILRDHLDSGEGGYFPSPRIPASHWESPTSGYLLDVPLVAECSLFTLCGESGHWGEPGS
jgi:hypothetical protein